MALDPGAETPGSVKLTLICYRISWSNPWQLFPSIHPDPRYVESSGGDRWVDGAVAVCSELPGANAASGESDPHDTGIAGYRAPWVWNRWL